MNMMKSARVCALTLALAGLGGAAMAAPAQVSYLQVSGWDNAAAQTAVNRVLAGTADAFASEVRAIPAKGDMEGFGSLTMKKSAETDRLLSVAVESYVIAPRHANGVARMDMKLFDKATGAEVDAYEALGCDLNTVRHAVLQELVHMQRQGINIDRRTLYAKLADRNYRPALFLSANGPAVYFQRGEIAASAEGAIVVVLPHVGHARA